MPASSPQAILRTRLRALRRARGWSQEHLAEVAGVGYKFLQDIESGRKQDLRLSTVAKLALPLEVEVWELLRPSDAERN